MHSGWWAVMWSGWPIGWSTPGAGRFLVTFVALLIALAAARFLYRRKIFLRV